MCYTIQFKHSKKHGEVNLVIQISVSEHVSKQSVTKTHLAYCRLKEVSIEAQTAFVPGCKHGEWPLSHTHVLASNFQPQVLPLLWSAIAVYAMSSKSLFHRRGEEKTPCVPKTIFIFTPVFFLL